MQEKEFIEPLSDREKFEINERISKDNVEIARLNLESARVQLETLKLHYELKNCKKSFFNFFKL